MLNLDIKQKILQMAAAGTSGCDEEVVLAVEARRFRILKPAIKRASTITGITPGPLQPPPGGTALIGPKNDFSLQT